MFTRIMFGVAATAVTLGVGQLVGSAGVASGSLEVCPAVIVLADHDAPFPCDPDGSQLVVTLASDQATCDQVGGVLVRGGCVGSDY